MLAVDLFSGAGGMSLGFERAGFQVLAAFDRDEKHIATYAANFPHTQAHPVDIRTLSGSQIMDICGPEHSIDVVFGGPPCQGFSFAGRRDIDDQRNELILEFARVVCELRPKAFVAENVVGILSPKYQNVIKEFYRVMREAGYSLPDEPYVLNAEDFYVPQSRRRVFFVGVQSRYQIPPPPVSIFQHLPAEVRRPNVTHALSDLPYIEDLSYLFDQDRYIGPLNEPTIYARELRKPKPTSVGPTPGISGFLRTQHSEEVKRRFAATSPGHREPISRFYKLTWTGFCPTLRAGTTLEYGKFMAPRPIHPDEPRVITVREAARLHSYPDWFEFYPTKWYGFMQVGNSVPPFLAQSVATSILSTIT